MHQRELCLLAIQVSLLRPSCHVLALPPLLNDPPIPEAPNLAGRRGGGGVILARCCPRLGLGLSLVWVAHPSREVLG